MAFIDSLKDPALLAVISATAGFLGKSAVDFFLSQQKEIVSLRLKTKAEHIASQLSEFYWPIYLRLSKDDIIWQQLLNKKDVKDSLLQKVSAEIIRKLVIPNHNEIVSIIERSIHLAQPDEQLKSMLLKYIKHVAIYEAISTTGEEMLFPSWLKEDWPESLLPEIERRTMVLQTEYDDLLGGMRASSIGSLKKTSFWRIRKR
ncbi:MAG: hypothetical protein QNJ46_32850 [Leptolyngbyaceae cyanobacterium MO_188.B28]|nr:hypothetical protein [Leptolyngbyaceae cyanobacterium MO_188.B28]